MKKKNILKKNYDFNKIIEQGRKIRTKNYILYFSPCPSIFEIQIGISVGKKTGNAVYRNREKRRLRSIIDSHVQLDKSTQCVLIALKHSLNLKHEVKEKEIKNLFERLK